jgi:acetyl esterase
VSPRVAVEVTRSGAPAVLRASRPDPDVRRLLLQLNVWPERLAGPHVLEDGRRDWQLAIKAFGSREPVAAVETRTVAGPAGPLRLRAYTPHSGSAPRPLIAYFHGGGFVVGDLYTAGSTCRALANRTGAVVVAVQYRLAPEHPLEAGRLDCLAAAEWLAANASELGADAAELAVAGDSAGGTLAAAVAQTCAQRGGPRLARQLLLYPATDMVSDSRSNHENAHGYLLTAERLAWVRRAIAEVSDVTDPRLSPLRTPKLSGVAPAVIVTAGFDPIRDEGLAYADRLRAAGVPVLGLHYPGQIHGFVSFDRVLLGARDALQRIGHAWTGVAAEPLHRGSDGALWLHPRQRWNESVVAGLVLHEQIRRSWRRLSERRQDDVRGPSASWKPAEK